MLDPRDQWAIQIEITNACGRNCSNCTRLVGHIREPFFVSLKEFEHTIQCLADFPTQSTPTDRADHKLVGMIGGEPMIHPEFPELCRIAKRYILRQNLGLWTSVHWPALRQAQIVRETFGYVNENWHDRECLHSPVLVAIKDVIHDEHEMKTLIDRCWLQRMWCSSVTPKGYFFCEVAGTLDLIFGGPGGLPVEPGCWRRPLKDFQSQIDRWCPRCGIPLNLRGRRDTDVIDDISDSNLKLLVNSPKVASGLFRLYDPLNPMPKASEPWRYLR